MWSLQHCSIVLYGCWHHCAVAPLQCCYWILSQCGEERTRFFEHLEYLRYFCPSYPSLIHNVGATAWLLHYSHVSWGCSRHQTASADTIPCSSLFSLSQALQYTHLQMYQCMDLSVCFCVELRNFFWIIGVSLVNLQGDIKGSSHSVMMFPTSLVLILVIWVCFFLHLSR